MSQRLIVFVKAPRLGNVKTRLATTMGEAAALATYCELVNILLCNLSNLPQLQLRFSPDDAEREIKPWLQSGWEACPQEEGDLTERLIRTFRDEFSQGAERVLIIGSDCPQVTTADIELGWKSLQNADLVVGPATDGGYWLIGLRKEIPELFEDIPWSTDKVLEKTLAIARAKGLNTVLLRTLSDVDTPADWERFQQSLSRSGDLSDSRAATPR